MLLYIICMNFNTVLIYCKLFYFSLVLFLNNAIQPLAARVIILINYLSIHLSIYPSTYPSVEDKKDYEFLVQGTKNKKDKTLFAKHSMQLQIPLLLF